jgi:SAM-dependent methyltransferase
MSNGALILGLSPWLQSPVGQYVLGWEQRQVDLAVADVFGFHALQVGLPELQGLRANRMPHRWQAGEVAHAHLDVQCDFDALPFDSQSLDLVVLPHTLESSRDPHHALREVERVLMPEGRVVILGFNPTSLWGLRQRAGQWRQRLAPSSSPLFLPGPSGLIGQRRLKDWLRLLNLEPESGSFGCYRPPFNRAAWLDRPSWMETAGNRWWPMLGAVYLLVAVKRVRAMRLVGLAQRSRLQPAAAAAAVAQRRPGPSPSFLESKRPS